MKKIVFSFDKLDLTEEIAKAVKEKQKTVALKGFRKGKAPLTMVEQIYKPQIESDALNKFVQSEFYKAVTESELKVVGYPNLENVNYKAGESVSFDAVVEIFPTVEIKPYDKLSFTQDKVEVTEEDVEKVKKQYLESKAEEKAIEDKDVALENGHFAIFNFEGEKEDGEKPENMKGSEFKLEIGSGQFIPGFEEGMIGLKAGEKKTIDLTFPSDYHAEELKDAKVKFHVELLEIKEKSYPEFNDEMAKDIGYESVEDFMTKTKENLEYQKNRQAKEKLNQEIIEKLVEENSFDVPQALVAQQMDYLKKDMEGTLKQQGFNDEMVAEYFSKWSDDLTTKAEFQVRSGLILDKLSKEFEVEATEADLDAKIEETAKASGLDSEQVKNYYTSNEQIKQNMMYAIREEKTFEKVIEKVTVK
jgi:trigger factor